MTNIDIARLFSGSMGKNVRFKWALFAPRLTCIALFLSGSTIQADDLAGKRFFEAKIRPVLIKNCLKCHSGSNPKGKLGLDSRARWVKGGDSGPAIVPGDLENSLLIRAIRHSDGVSAMPPNKRLPTDIVKVLEQWVARGAPDPRDDSQPRTTQPVGSGHWCFQPVADVSVPDVEDEWPRSDIDRYIHTKQKMARVEPVSDADRYTWMRRVSFDLTGLPPAPADIEAFVTDKTSNARQRVVDRLMSSPEFGERWARHWLDMSCYADTVGSANMPMRHAWRYRDYVIESFNNDKPLDQFVREQIAGDLLPAKSKEQRREHLIATGFLAIGPWQLAEQDKAQLRMDVVDHQITRIGTMFLGMTLDCARCHDHKFDPVAQRDYYALAGIFANVTPLNGIWRSNVSGVVTSPIPELESEQRNRESAVQDHAAEYAAARKKWQESQDSLRRAEQKLAELAIDDPNFEEAKKKAEAARKETTEREGDWRFLQFHAPDVPRTHSVVRQATPGNVRINLRGSANALGDEVQRGFVEVISTKHPPIAKSSDGRMELVDWLFAAENPLTARVFVNRIWAQLFGRGIVESVDYFGIGAGDNEPTHPELLDFLARDLHEKGWSLKALLRQIVLSRTYGLSTSRNDAATRIDPENRLLWRANPRRLDAEMIRDGMLAVSGQLQTGGGGLSIPFEDRTALRPGDLVNPPTVGGGFKVSEDVKFKRSVYQPVIQSFVHKSQEVLDLFDMPRPNEIVGQRVSTVVPTQALFLMNSSFVKEAAAKLADKVLADESDHSTEERLNKLWLRTVGRPIGQKEMQSATAILSEESDCHKAWQWLCHSLLASNEFLFRR